MDLYSIINDIKKNIILTDLNCIYIGVGTFAGLKEPNGSLSEKNYHQYPPFLQNLINSIGNLNLYIILIDPQQENPPYMVIDKGFIINNNNNIFKSQDERVTLYTLRENVYTEPYDDVHGLDMTPHLRDINKFVIENNITFVYNDFTGRDNRILAEYFDEDIGEHLDHIIYGLGLREYYGCYVDLTDQCLYHPYYIDEHGVLKLFNIYYYIVNNRLSCFHPDIKMKYMSANANAMANADAIANNSNNMFNKHIDKFGDLVKYELANEILQTLRVAVRLKRGQHITEYDSKIIEFSSFPYKKRDICLEFYRSQSFHELFEYLLDEYGHKLNVFSFFKKLDISGREILELITIDEDPFKWYNNVKHFVC